MANGGDDEVFVMKFARRSGFPLSNLHNIIDQHFNLPHVQVRRCENGGVVITGLLDGIPDDVQSQDHESFDHILEFIGWAEGRLELPKCSKSVAPTVFDESPGAMEENLDQHVDDEFEVPQANSGQLSSMVVHPRKISKCDVSKEDGLWTDVDLKIDGTLIIDEKLVQIEPKLESNLDAYQLLDKMPQSASINNHEPSEQDEVQLVKYMTSTNTPLLMEFENCKASWVVKDDGVETLVFDPGGVYFASLNGDFVYPMRNDNLWFATDELYGFTQLLKQSKSDEESGNHNMSLALLASSTSHRVDVDLVACLELHYFDPGGKKFKLGDSLICNRTEFLADYVNLKPTDLEKNYYLRCINEEIPLAAANSMSTLLVSLGGELENLTSCEDIVSDYGKTMTGCVKHLIFDPGGVKAVFVHCVTQVPTDICAGLCCHFGANSKHGQDKVAQGSSKKVMFDLGGEVTVQNWHTSSDFVQPTDAPHRLENDKIMLKSEGEENFAIFAIINLVAIDTARISFAELKMSH